MPKRKARSRAPEPESPRPHVASPSAPPWLTPARIVAAMVAAYVLVYGFFVWIKFRYYLYIDFDLAIFAQATDQALRGTLFSSIRGMNWLGDHVSLILFVIAPLYALARHPMTLLMLQTVVLALGAWPVFSLARRELKHDGIAAALAGVYLLYPAIGYTNLFEFHPEVLATTTLLATIACMAADRLVPTLVFAVLSVMCKEDVALVVGMLGLSALLPGRPRRWTYAIALVGTAIASLVVSFGIIRPALGSSAAEYGKMYHEWGDTMGQVALHLLKNPVQAIAAFYDTPGQPFDIVMKHTYWPMMLGPLLFLPLWSPLTLVVALPVLAEHFLSFRPQQHGLIYQYTALVTPVFVAAAVRGTANLVRIVTRQPITAETMRASAGTRRLAFVVSGLAIVASVVCNLLYGPLLKQGWIWVQPASENIWPDLRDRTQRPYRDRLVARVPKQGGVVASFEFLGRLASRRTIHSLHHLYTGFYTFSSEPYPVPRGIDAFLADIGDPRLASYVKPSTPLRLRDLMAANHLRPAAAAGDLILLLREPADTVELVRVGVPPPPVARSVAFDRQLALEGFALPQPEVSEGGLLTVQTYWRRYAPADRQFGTQFLLVNGEGKVVFAVNRHLGYLFYPVSEWPQDSTVRETYRLPIPGQVAPGTYTLALRVAWWRDARSGLSQADPPLSRERPAVVLGPFTVTPASR